MTITRNQNAEPSRKEYPALFPTYTRSESENKCIMFDEKKPVFTPEYKVTAIYYELYRVESFPEGQRDYWRAELQAGIHDYDDQLVDAAGLHARLQAVTDQLLAEPSN